MSHRKKCHALAMKLHEQITSLEEEYEFDEVIDTLLGLAIGYAKQTDVAHNTAKAHMLIFINNGFRNVED